MADKKLYKIVFLNNGKVYELFSEGVTTSGGYSPTLHRAIAFARVPADAAEAEVDIRGKRLPARIVSPPFVRNGEAREGIL